MTGSGAASLLTIPAFALLYLVVALLWQPPPALALVYLGMSGLTFVAYALDKRAAAHQARRTPEKTLHVLALVGGWPGALLAQHLLRHKLVKQPFRTVLWAMVVLNVAAFLFWYTPLARLAAGSGA